LLVDFPNDFLATAEQQPFALHFCKALIVPYVTVGLSR
jgi:hypothetical protein